jgi:hypothetical protein
LIKKQQEELQKLNQRIAENTRYYNQQLDAQNQKVEMLRSQLAEQLRPANVNPTTPSESDDWLSIISTPNPSPPQGTAITEQQARGLVQQELSRQQQAYQQEAQKVAQLNQRFAQEYPELNQDEAARTLIQNQFLNLSSLRPDLPAEERYKLAIANSLELLPKLRPVTQQRAQAQQQQQVRKRNQDTSGYMPVQGQGVPTSQAPTPAFPFADTRPIEVRMSKAQEDMKKRQAEYAARMLGGS